MAKDQEAETRVVKFTPRNVRTLPAVDGRQADWRDSLERGLTLRVSANGHRSFALVYRFAGRVRRYTIGTVDDVMLASARARARTLKGQVANGTDPQEDKRRAAEVAEAEAQRQRAQAERLTVKGLSELWLASPEAKAWRPVTRRGFERFITAEVLPRIGTKAVEDVKAADVARFLDAIAERSPSSAARCFEVVRAMFRWANLPKKGGVALTIVNPCAGLRYVHKVERERTHTNDELRRIFAAVEGTEVADLVPLIAYTAARSHEARAARWSDLDLERKLWTVPPEDAKAGRPHQVPLSEGTMRVLLRLRDKSGSGEYLFPAPTKCPTCGRPGHMDRPGKALAFVGQGDPETDPKDKRADLGGALHLHDVRRTVADRLRADLDVPPHVVDAGVLGHEVPKLWRTYMPTANLTEVRRALDRWSVHLDAILSRETAQPAKVVPIAAVRP
jgi:integrase